MRSEMDPSLQELLLEKKWSVIHDHTEKLTGDATPVLKVGTSNDPALLRFSVEDSQLRAYKNLEKSNVAPNLIEHGIKNGAEWALVEWIDGTPFDKTAMSSSQLKDCTLEIITAATALYVCDTPEFEESKRLKQAQEAEDGFRSLRLLEKSGPPIAHIIQEVGKLSMALHGDLIWTSALRTPNGIMFIDPVESYGPREKDLAWMVAIVTAEIASEGNPDKALAVAEDYIKSIHERVQFLTEDSLRAWTSLGLVYAAYLNLHYELASLHECQNIVKVGGLLYYG